MSYSSEVLADGPLAYWRQDESSGTTMADSSGNGRSGTYQNTANLLLGQPSLLTSDASSKAVRYNGDGRGLVTHGAWMNTTAMTVEAWINLTTVSGVQTIAVRRSGANVFQLRINAGKLESLVWSNLGLIVTTAPSAMSLGVHHVALTYLPGTAAHLYVDGTQAAQTLDASSSTLNPATSDLYVGYNTGFDGEVPNNLTIDEVALYGAALSGTRIASHYTSGTQAPVVPTMTAAATLRSKTAAFTVGTVAALSLAGSLPSKTAVFTVATPAADVTMSSTLARKTATFTVMANGSVSLAGALSAKTAAFSMSANGQASLAASLQPKAAQVVLTSADRAALLAASLPRKTASLTLAALPSLGLHGQLQSKIATFASRAIIPVTSAPDIVTHATSVVVAQAFGPVTMRGTQPVYTVAEAAIARGRQQIVVNGVDVSYFRDVVTPDVDYTLLEPLLYGPGSVEFPQVSACFETEGVGDLWWLRAQAPVEVNLVVDDVVVAPLYKGFVAAFDKSGRTLTVQLGGEANGRAAMRDRQVPIFPRINDVGHQLADAVRDLGLPHYPPLGAVTGIEAMTTGGTGHLDHINNLVAKSWTRSGKQWTVMPDPATGVYETHRKDATTVHASAFIDDARTVATLRRDIAEEPNQIFVTCVTPAGMRVRFGKYPGLVQGPVPDFPGSMFLGDTGEGVRLLTGKLHASGYLRLSEVAGGYDDDVMRAVIQLQDDAGLPETGEVNLKTWRALYDLDVTGLSLEWANIQPAAQRSKTRKFNRSANGTIMGFNDEFDPDVIVRHRSIDLGAGVTRKQAREYARTVLHDSDDANWVGDITFNTGALIRGEATVGMTLTAGDIMDARELRPGMNLWLPAFDGGTLLHVSACQTRGDVVTATVDTRFRDAMEVWEIIARNKESRNDPSRQRERSHRSSTIAKDSIGEWDEFGGFLGVDRDLEPGWNVFPVVAAMEGQIRKLRVELKTPAEFVVAVFGRKVDAGWLKDINPDPLTVAGTRTWEKKANAFDDQWILYSAGTHDEPGGYWPGRKKWESVDGEPESSGTLSGKFVDEAGFPYFAADRKVIYVALWVRGENKIETGRVMWPQLEAGV